MSVTLGVAAEPTADGMRVTSDYAGGTAQVMPIMHCTAFALPRCVRTHPLQSLTARTSRRHFQALSNLRRGRAGIREH
jgi:hypothetical protein